MKVDIVILLIGLLSGAYGTIVGAGGGFIFVPALLLVFHIDPKIAAGTGLVIVLLNSLSGAFGYMRQKKINYKMSLLIAIGAIPGTFFGTWALQYTSQKMFYTMFATILLALGIFLIIKKAPKQIQTVEVRQKFKVIPFILIGLLLGTISSFFGIGGGWLLVPILVYLVRIVPHQAAATSLFSLFIYSAIGVVTQISYGNIDWNTVLWGGFGVITGAQIGVLLSTRIPGKMVIQMLSIVLIAVSIKLFLAH